jgi:hypothetical protein
MDFGSPSLLILGFKGLLFGRWTGEVLFGFGGGFLLRLGWWFFFWIAKILLKMKMNWEELQPQLRIAARLIWVQRGLE